MEKQSTRSVGKMEGLLGPDPLTEALRGKIRETIMTLVEVELAEVLAALPYERTGQRRGYCHGSKSRTVTTELGAVPMELPRARMIRDGRAEEWQSHLVRRYERRAVAVDSALLGTYLSGANQRRMKGALSPLLRDAPLSRVPSPGWWDGWLRCLSSGGGAIFETRRLLCSIWMRLPFGYGSPGR